MIGVDFVAPLPPVRSGIADYSVDLLPALAERCDLRLIRLPGQPIADELAARYPVVDPGDLGADGRLPLYQMGNNEHHHGVWELATRHPGVLTLHDLVLHHFLIDRTARHGDHDAYRRALTAEHGWIGSAAARPLRWPGGGSRAAQFALPAHRGLLAAQRGVLVHSRWAADTLAEEVGVLRVRVVPMGVPLPELSDDSDGRRFRRRHRLPVNAPLLGSFGFQTPMKRTEEVVRALADPALAEVHLVVAGEIPEIVDLQGVAADVGVGERLHVLGYLPFEELASAISAVDLCLNLRYPTAGETSASLLRILAVGKPAVVSDYAQSAELPEDGVIKLPVGDGERTALAALLPTLLADRERLRRMGRAARHYVATHHQPAAAAAAVAAACAEWKDAEPSAPTMPVPPPTSLIWHALAGELDVAGAEPPWAEGERRQLVVRLRNCSAARWLASEREGGLALEVQLWTGNRNLAAQSGWIPLPFDLDPGEEQLLEVLVRRPPGEALLRLRPHVLGRTALDDLGGPVWEARL